MAMSTPAATITMTNAKPIGSRRFMRWSIALLRVAQAAQRLGMSRKQIERPVSRYLDDEPSGLVSRKRGRLSNNQLAPGIAERAVKLIRERYADFGPTLAAEKLEECHGVHR
ncbi:helix-turn-helix domain-containing protein [Variovorax humicola]|uniref:Helix-turn-helix domain-containing protein n=1 Tax=Variovorax humicola TaxID=1769758 RepID=A0ABU8W4I9_9BURK